MFNVFQNFKTIFVFLTAPSELLQTEQRESAYCSVLYNAVYIQDHGLHPFGPLYGLQSPEAI